MAIKYLLNNRCFCLSILQDALSWYTFDAAFVISNSAIAKKKVDVEDRGGNHELFEHLMHSWVGYELVRFYSNMPKLWSDLNEWLPDLYQLFSYFGEKQRDPSKSPTHLLTVLFERTEHCSYFRKLPFGKRTKFEKMANTTIPLVILTWLRQLQEHFFKQPENNPQINWNDSGRYCNVPVKFAVSKGVNYVHMTKTNNKNAFKIESFDSIKPNKKSSKKVVKSLFE
jgi:hypothetical protein